MKNAEIIKSLEGVIRALKEDTPKPEHKRPEAKG